MEVDWVINRSDVIEGPEGWRLSLSRDPTFTRIYIVFTDAGTGQRDPVDAEVPSGHPMGPMERAVHAKNPITRTEAQALADEAVSVLGESAMVPHAWLSLKFDTLLKHRKGTDRAAAIKPGESALLEAMDDRCGCTTFSLKKESPFVIRNA